MKKRTLQKILADPKFNPANFLEQAIVEFVERYPEEVANDKVALNHLVEDPDISDKIVSAVDVNDPDMLSRYFDALRQSKHWGKEDTCAELLGRLDGLEEAKADEVFAVLKRFAPNFSSISRPSKFGALSAVLAEDRLFELMDEALVKKGTKDWEEGDWRVAIGTSAGTAAFIEALKEGDLNLKKGGGLFPLISKLARETKTHPLSLLEACEARWDTYVCFKCGRGSGVDKNGHAAATNVLKSISGYTLHWSQCDPDEEFPSPWKSIKGDERELSFECDGCGQTFTTASGLTLHKKKC